MMMILTIVFTQFLNKKQKRKCQFLQEINNENNEIRSILTKDIILQAKKKKKPMNRLAN